MKVTVKDKYLNVRAGNPSVNAPCYQYLAPGSELEVDGELYKGDQYNGIDTWMKDIGGNYYWGGGVTKMASQIIDGGILDYNLKSTLPEEIRNTKGENVTVGIIDTGCFKHGAFKNINIKGKNFVNKNDDYEDVSSQSHGTFISGIISAGECIGNKMKGIAPNVTLVIAKITSEAGISDRDVLLEGLKWMIAQQPDIINCSFDFSPSIDIEKFNDIFISEEAKNIIWVAAGQDNGGLFNDTIYYPAIHKNFIAVGSLRIDTLNENKLGQINTKIKYLVQESSFISTDRFDLYSNGVGSSFGSALVTGNLALIKSHFKKNDQQNDNPKNCIDFLDQNLKQLNSPLQLETPFAIFKR